MNHLLRKRPSPKRQSAFATWLTYLAVGLLLPGLSACTESGTTTRLEATSPPLTFSLPPSLATATFLAATETQPAFANLRPEVSLSNGSTVSMIREGARWAGFIDLRTNAVYTVTVTWIERFSNRDLPLTRRTFDLTVNSDGSAVESGGTGFDEDFDADDDRLSNFAERRAGTDPFTANAEQVTVVPIPENTPAANGIPLDNLETDVTSDVPLDLPAAVNADDALVQPIITNEQTMALSEPDVIVPAIADVIVPRISESDAPGIDGRGVILDTNYRFAGEWAQAVQSDISGSVLSIDNLMIDINAEITQDTPYRRWAAMHDGRYLYVVVIVDDNGRRHRDSGANVFHDDSLELFLDADNSKSTSYGDDDFHRLFPLREAGGTASKTGVSVGDVAGPNSTSRRLVVDFSTGPGIGPDGIRRKNYEQDVYELRLALDSAGLGSDAPFGFELQINDDDDGLGRDSKWGWKHPARLNVDVDNTYTNPSFMGTLMLE